MASPQAQQIMAVSLVILTVVLGGWYVVDKTRSIDPLQDRNFLRRGENLPSKKLAISV
jgi:hypothetical protein